MLSNGSAGHGEHNKVFEVHLGIEREHDKGILLLGLPDE